MPQREDAYIRQSARFAPGRLGYAFASYRTPPTASG